MMRLKSNLIWCCLQNQTKKQVIALLILYQSNRSSKCRLLQTIQINFMSQVVANKKQKKAELIIYFTQLINALQRFCRHMYES
ncbi:unnamed protein product [Paramecium primaurelia]|uniref:Uncharacterized protein n=1 Tax=Paramecium primaurelia TaxID=5886 RepID=A0A8S1JVA3_PARPR|nr:unnamed protein product [Paramecium primaurelia]